jgi:hypothetical protein
VAVEQPPWSFGVMPLPFVVGRSAASFILTYILQSYFGNLVDVETIKIDDKFEAWTNKGWRY